MNELIKQKKSEYLEGLKEERKKAEATTAVRKAEILAEKRVSVADKEAQLDDALRVFIADEQNKLSLRVNAQREAVAAKKAELLKLAEAEAEASAAAEVGTLIRELDKEIAAVENEIGG